MRYRALATLFIFSTLISSLCSVSALDEESENAKYRAALENFSMGNALLKSYIDGTSPQRKILSEAIFRYTKAASLKPDFAEAYFNRGICNIQMGATSRDRQIILRRTEALFQEASEFKTSYAPEALFAIGQAQHLLGTADMIYQSPEWKRAMVIASDTLKSVISRFPNTPAADKARTEIALIEWYQRTDFGTFITGRSKTKRPSSPIQEPMSLSETKSIEAIAKDTVAKIRTGVLADETTTIVAYYDNPSLYSFSGNVENTSGLTLHKVRLTIGPAEVRNYNSELFQFRMLKYWFTYDGKEKKGKLDLPLSEYTIELGKRGKTPLTPIIEMENIKISIALLDASSGSPSNYYKDLLIRVVTEVID